MKILFLSIFLTFFIVHASQEKTYHLSIITEKEKEIIWQGNYSTYDTLYTNVKNCILQNKNIVEIDFEFDKCLKNFEKWIAESKWREETCRPLKFSLILKDIKYAENVDYKEFFTFKISDEASIKIPIHIWYSENVKFMVISEIEKALKKEGFDVEIEGF